MWKIKIFKILHQTGWAPDRQRVQCRLFYVKCSGPIWSVFSGLWSESVLFSRNLSGNGLDLHEKVQIWSKMEELTLKSGLFQHKFNNEVDVLECWKRQEFSKKSGKSMILWYWSGFKVHSGLDLVRIGTKKWSGFGPILINLRPIWQVVALESPYVLLILEKKPPGVWWLQTWPLDISNV